MMLACCTRHVSSYYAQCVIDSTVSFATHFVLLSRLCHILILLISPFPCITDSHLHSWINFPRRWTNINLPICKLRDDFTFIERNAEERDICVRDNDRWSVLRYNSCECQWYARVMPLQWIMWRQITELKTNLIKKTYWPLFCNKD